MFESCVLGFTQFGCLQYKDEVSPDFTAYLCCVFSDIINQKQLKTEEILYKTKQLFGQNLDPFSQLTAGPIRIIQSFSARLLLEDG